MPSRCVVGGCSNEGKDGVKLHTIPYYKDDRPIAKARRKRWISFVLQKRAKWTPSASSVICSQHFSPEDYSERLSLGTSTKKMAHLIRDEVGIVPVPRIYCSKEDNERDDHMPSKRARRQILREITSNVRSVECSSNINNDTDDSDPTINTDNDVAPSPNPTRDFGTQTAECIGCKSLRDANRLSNNKLIDLKLKYNGLIEKQKTKYHKTSCGTQCDLYNERSGMGPNNFDEAMSIEHDDDDDEFLEEISEDYYDITEEEPDDRHSEPEETPENIYSSCTDSETETETETETEEEEMFMPWNDKRFHSTDKNLRTEPKYIAFLSKLLLLFSFCHACKADNPSVKLNEVGTMLTITTRCNNPKCPKKENVWKSQPNMTGTKIPAGNFLLSFAILVAGGSASKVLKIFKHMGISCITLTTFFKHQSEKLFPAISLYWKKYQETLLRQVRALGEPITVSGDARHDSMGHSAKFGVYSIFCCNIPVIIHFSLVQRNEAGSSSAMEYLGFQRCFDFLFTKSLSIRTFISDRHTSIAKHLREKLKHITHYFDLWHLKKSIRKSLTKISKDSGCESIKEWIQPCLNHLHWSAISTTCGTGRIILSKFNSFMSHIINKHENLNDPLFDKCAHSPDIQPRKWLLPDSLAYEKLVAALSKPSITAGIKQASPLSQTSCLEGFHSLVNHFCPKMIAFSFPGMYCRQILAVAHFNQNLVRDVKKKADGTSQVRFIYPKFKNGEASVREVRVTPNYGYVEEIYATFLEAVKDIDTLKAAAKELQEMTPSPMNTMLEKESKHAALERKAKREMMTVAHVPPTKSLSEVLALEEMAKNMNAERSTTSTRSRPHCLSCKQPMKGHSKVKDCPKNKKN